MIRQLQRRTDSVGSQQFEAPTQEETQSRTRSVGTAVRSRQFEAPRQEETQSRIRNSGTAAGQANTSNATGQAAGQGEVGQAARPKDQGKKDKGSIMKGLISGTIISESLILKDIRYTALIAVLAIIFIANKFNAEAVERQIIVLEQEVRDMRAESLSVSAELGSVSRQSEITELVKERGLGLEELREPPYRIVVNE